MRLQYLLLLPIFSLAVSKPHPPRQPEADSKTELERLQDAAFAKHQKRLAASNGTCDASNLIVRKEFGSLAPAERKAYTDAVLCLQSLPPKSPASLVPGARSRFDDFVATHINQTLTIHFTGTFLAWHRYFVHTYETALRNECNYTGSQPYWNWPLYSSSPQTSPIFNGDDYSMSGNGEFIPGHPGVLLGPVMNFTSNGSVPAGDIFIEPGLGGGCVTEGPFKNMSVNLGPVGLTGVPPAPGGGFGYNPRCLKRDVGGNTADRFTNETEVTSLLQENNIWDFEMTMQGRPGGNSIGVHGGGHFTIAGDPGGDLYTSPGDPAFFIHHAQIDRIWWMWQSADASRINAISGTGTYLNSPPSPNTTLDTELDLGFAGGSTVVMKDLMDTTAGLFCYIYE